VGFCACGSVGRRYVRRHPQRGRTTTVAGTAAAPIVVVACNRGYVVSPSTQGTGSEVGLGSGSSEQKTRRRTIDQTVLSLLNTESVLLLLLLLLLVLLLLVLLLPLPPVGPIEPTSRNLLTPHSLAGEHLRGARY
jgi:hypothetical protein